MTANDSTHAERKQQAHALLQTNRLAEAHELCNELLGDDATDAEIHYLLGVISGKLGQLSVANEHFRQTVALRPGLVMAHCGLGASFKAMGKFAEAADAFRAAVRLKPDFAEAYCDLGDLLVLLAQPEEARACFASAVRYKPTLAPAHYRLGAVCYSLGRLEEAAEHLRHAGELSANLVEARVTLGRVLTALGRLDEARDACRFVLRLQPGHIEAMLTLAATHEWEGDIKAAQDMLSPLLAQGTQHPGVALAFARLCRHDNRCHDAAEQIGKLLARGGLTKTDERQLRYALGKLLDSMGDYEAAFAEYRVANAILPPPYDADQFRRGIESTISYFSAERFAMLPRANAGNPQPVFIVGMPRSGTSMVEQILASHPKVYGAGELTDIPRLVARLPETLGASQGYPACLSVLNGESASRLAREYLDHLAALANGAQVVTDKMPHNFLHLGVIALLFPDARVIHCQRDARDTGLSIYFQYFNASHSYSHDLAQIGSHYREQERIMAHWQRVLPLPMLHVRYEDIVTSPETNIRKLVEFCGLEWDERCLRFHAQRRFVNTASYDQVRQPLHPKSIGRWRHYKQFLGPLMAELARP